jgi:hypothetical protein
VIYDLKRIFLGFTFVGLVIEVDRIDIEITAVSGEGNLLGNLLCAIAGLLDPQTSFLTILQNLLDALNNILG